jgi:hypothetical protein
MRGDVRTHHSRHLISHRLSTIRRADQILALENGEILEQGTHEQMLAAGGQYKQLYDKQYRFERDLFINPGEDFTPELPKVKLERGPTSRRLSDYLSG